MDQKEISDYDKESIKEIEDFFSIRRRRLYFRGRRSSCIKQ